MKPTKAQEMMIKDGLPKKAIMSKQERDAAWQDHPPSSTMFLSNPIESNKMNHEEIVLLLELKESKERGAASLGCSHHRIPPIAILEKLGFAKQHGFGPTSFVITDKGLKEAEKYKELQAQRKKEAAEKPIEVETTPRTLPKLYKAPKTKVERAAKTNPNLSPISIECGVTSNNRTKALDFLYSKIGKMQAIAPVMKAVYGDGGSVGALDTVIRALQIDLSRSSANDKYEVKRVKDSKGVYTYGFYKK